MASGEGQDLAAEWQQQVLDGKLAPVVKSLAKEKNLLSSQRALAILTNLTSYIVKAKKSKEPLAIKDIDAVASLTYSCAEVLATGTTSRIKRILQSVHFNIFYLYTQDCIDWVAKTCLLLPLFYKSFKDTEEDENKDATIKTLLEMGSIAWNMAFKITDSHSCPNLELCLISLDLLCKLDCTSKSAVDRSCRIMNAFSKDKNCLKSSIVVIAKTIWTILENNKDSDTIKKHVSNMVAVLLESEEFTSKTLVEANVKNLNELFPKDYSSTLESVQIPLAILHCLRTTQKIEEGQLKDAKTALNGDHSKRIAETFWNFLVQKKGIDWKKASLPSTAIFGVQELLFSCLKHLSNEQKMDTVVQILLMSNAHLPTEKRLNAWDNTTLSSLTWTMKAIDSVKVLMTDQSNNCFHQKVVLVHNTIVMGWNFHQKANCCREAAVMYNYFDELAYDLADVINLSEDDSLKLLKSLADGTKFVANSLIRNRPDESVETTKKGLYPCLKLIICVTKLKENISKRDFEMYLLKSLEIWCDARVAAQTAFQDVENGLCNYFKSYGLKVSHQDMERMLCLEIESFCNLRYNTDIPKFLKVSCASLEALNIKSAKGAGRYRTLLALAMAKSKSDELSDIEESVKLASEAAEVLQKEVKKEKSLDLLVLLILALHQEYLSTLTFSRVKNKALNDVPLTVRAPSKRDGPEEEQQTSEAWENAVELSQLGQILSCRLESKNFKPLLIITNYTTEILKLTLNSNDVFVLEPILLCLESIALHFIATGHEWCAIKCWNHFYLLSLLIECPKRQLRGISWLISKFSLEENGKFHKWLTKKTSSLIEQLNSKEKSMDNTLTVMFFDVCMAQCFVNSNMPNQAAEIVLRLRREIDVSTSSYYMELMARTFLVGSQVMSFFKSSDPIAEELASAFVENVGAANLVYSWAMSFVSSSKPAERELRDLRLLELMISSGLWLSSLSTMCGKYKASCYTLQSLLQKLQRMHFPTRVAQILSLLGDLDAMVPDTTQVQQRLFWNQKILNLGSAIVGENAGKSSRDNSPSATPSKSSRKEHQLTASCSNKCHELNSSCTMCKNPLYQSCKAHYLFLATTNEEAFWTLHCELEKANTLRSERLTSLAWTNITDSIDNKTGWMQMLQGPLDLLKIRVLLANCAKTAAKGDAFAAMRNLLVTKEQLKRTKVPIARYLENWATAEEVAIGMQILKIGPWDAQLKPRSFSLAPEYLSADENSRPSSPTPNIVIPSIPPSKPKRRGRRPLIDEPAYIAPPNATRIKTIDLTEKSDEEDKVPPVTKVKVKLVPKTCKKPNFGLAKHENSPQFLDISPISTTTKSKRQLVKPAASKSKPVTPAQSSTRNTAFMTAVKKPPSKFSSSSNDSPQSEKSVPAPVSSCASKTARTMNIAALTKQVSTITLDSDKSSSDASDIVVKKRRARIVETTDSDNSPVCVTTRKLRQKKLVP